MSLYVNGREVTRKELEKNFKTLNDPIHNYAPFTQRYVPPSTVGYSTLTANEAVQRAGLAQAKVQNVERQRKLRLIRLSLERKRKQRRINNGPTTMPRPPVPVVRQPAFSHS